VKEIFMELNFFFSLRKESQNKRDMRVKMGKCLLIREIKFCMFSYILYIKSTKPGLLQCHDRK